MDGTSKSKCFDYLASRAGAHINECQHSITVAELERCCVTRGQPTQKRHIDNDISNNMQ